MLYWYLDSIIESEKKEKKYPVSISVCIYLKNKVEKKR